jgi:hypothetical protein
MFFTHRTDGGRLRLDRFKFWLMGVVAMSTEKIGSLARTRKVSRSFPMNTRSPVSINRPMTFATEPVAFREVYEFPIVKPQLISVFCIVTIEAPSHGLGMMKPGLCVFFFQFPFFSIYLHGGMAVATGKHSLCYGRRSHRELFARPICRGYKAES